MTVDQGRGPAGVLTGVRAAGRETSPKQGREAGMVPTGGHGSGRGKRAWPYCAATLYTLLVPGTVRAMDGFRPGLWAITTTFSGAMAFTSHGDDCLRRIGPVATTTGDINPDFPLDPYAEENMGVKRTGKEKVFERSQRPSIHSLWRMAMASFRMSLRPSVVV